MILEAAMLAALKFLESYLATSFFSQKRGTGTAVSELINSTALVPQVGFSNNGTTSPGLKHLANA